MFLKTLLVVLTLISFVGFVYSLIFQIENSKKQISKWKWVIIAEIILVIWRGVWYKEIDKEKSLEDLISLMLHTLMMLGIKLFFEYKEQIIKKIAELKNYFCNYSCMEYIKNNQLTWEVRKKLIFARAHLCSSSLIQWIQSDRREILSKLGKGNEYYKKARGYLTSHPDSIDGYLVKTLGDESMYNIEKRMKLTDKDYEELLIRSQRLENFIKEELEKGTEFEGEFDKRFPELIKHEEERWEHYEIRKKILNKEYYS